MQYRVHERRVPGVADHRRTEDDVAELPRETGRQVVASVDRKRERVGRLVDTEVLAFERTALVRSDEREPDLALVDSFRGEDRANDRGRLVGVELGAASIEDLNVDHRPLLPPLRSRLLRVQLVRVDDPLDELVPDDVLVTEPDERDP